MVEPATIICKSNVLLMISIFISGCAENISIKDNPIGKSIPEHWSGPLPQTGEYTGQWWNVFQDSMLTMVFDDFQENSPDLKAIASRLEMARQMAKITSAGSLPSVGLGISGASRKQNLSAFGLSEDFFGGNQGGTSGNNGVTSFESENYGLNLSFQWELDLWGRLFNQRQAAMQDFRSTEYDLAYLNFSLQIQLVKTFYHAVETQNQFQLAQETLTSISELADMVASRYEKGLLSSLDLRLTQSSVSSAKAQLENRHQVYLITVRNLEALLGQYPDGNYLVNTLLPNNLPPIPAGLPADILKRRPDIQS
ncbi:MAG TPA: TolC family protein, partial [Candidatus Marinimicrobia bacterium]|nr:TolC family protein [Candidatus Neomarinimicrobiota bacterium]